MKNRIASMLMETGISYNKQKLHQRRYFHELLEDRANEMPTSMPELLRLSRSNIETLNRMHKQLLHALKTDHTLAARVERLMTVPGVGQVLSITWRWKWGTLLDSRRSKMPSVIADCAEPSEARAAKPNAPDFQAT